MELGLDSSSQLAGLSVLATDEEEARAEPTGQASATRLHQDARLARSRLARDSRLPVCVQAILSHLLIRNVFLPAQDSAELANWCVQAQVDPKRARASGIPFVVANDSAMI